MKVDKIINIRLTEDEMETAILEYLANKLPNAYFEHIRKNKVMIDFEDDEWVLLVDGVLDGGHTAPEEIKRKITLVSEANTGYSYTTTTKDTSNWSRFKKYDPKLRKHVSFKIKED